MKLTLLRHAFQLRFKVGVNFTIVSAERMTATVYDFASFIIIILLTVHLHKVWYNTRNIIIYRIKS